MIHHFWGKKIKILKYIKILKLLFQLVFSTYLPNVLLKFRAGVFFGWKFNSSSKEYPCCILYIWTLLHKKWEIHQKMWLQSRFTCISHFSCSRVHQKYATWVLLGWGIKISIQRVLRLKIWVKTLGDKLKVRVEKVVFLMM